MKQEHTPKKTTNTKSPPHFDVKKAILEIRHMGRRQWLIAALTKAFYEARQGKIHTVDEHRYEVEWIKNLSRLADAIIERRYQPGSSVVFVVFDPMVREIFAAPFQDRVVHHFLYDLQAGWWDRRFIRNSFSCRVGRGTLSAVKCCQRDMIRVTKNGKLPARVFKGDVKGHFMSLNRRKIFKRVEWGLKQQFRTVMLDPDGRWLFETCRFLWQKVIFDDPVEKARPKSPPRFWDPDVLPPEKSLYNQPEGQGIVIGNLTSQLVSNIFMDMLDRFITITLGYKFYGRYVDDFYIMFAEKDWPKFRKDLKKIELFLKNEMSLTLHPHKRYLQSVYKGVNFVGARVHLHCLFPSNRIQRRFEASVVRLARGEGNIDTVTSYLGIMRHLDSYHYAKRVLDETFSGGAS